MNLPNTKNSQLIDPNALDEALSNYWHEYLPTADEVTSGLVGSCNFVVYLSACGFNKHSVLKLTRMDEKAYNYIMKREGIAQLIQTLQIQAVNEGPLERFRSLVDKAITRVEEVLMSATRDSDVLRAAELVFDRALGKVAQQVEVKAESPLKKLLEKITTEDAITAEFKREAEDAELVLSVGGGGNPDDMGKSEASPSIGSLALDE